MEQENTLPQAGAWFLGVPFTRRYSQAEWECLYQDDISYPIAEILVHDGGSKTYHHDTLVAAAPDMYSTLADICMEKSARICECAPESCQVCQIRKNLQKARGE